MFNNIGLEIDMSVIESAYEGIQEALAQKRRSIQRIDDPAAFYEQNASQLAVVGADAFGQLSEDFGPQVAERFQKAEFGHALYDGDEIVGFGLFDMLRGQHWQPALD